MDLAIDRCRSSAIMVAAAEVQEAIRLSQEEKLLCIKNVVDQVNGRVPVIAGASDTSTKGTIELGRKAKDLGADALMMMPPFGIPIKGALRGPTLDDVVSFFDLVSHSIDLPILIYNTQALSTHIPLGVLEKIFEIDSIVGMEESSQDFQVLTQIGMKLSDKVSLLIKTPVFLPALDVGMHGSITPVLFSQLGADLYDAYLAGDRARARKIQLALCNMPPHQFYNASTVTFYKEALRQLGLDVGLPRRPTPPADEYQKSVISDAIRNYYGLSPG